MHMLKLCDMINFNTKDTERLQWPRSVALLLIFNKFRTLFYL